MITDDASSTRRGPCILVVDDEPANTLLLEVLLETWGFTDVTSINDPARVIDVFGELSPDLVLLDLNMPALDGFDVLRLLRVNLPGSSSVPVIVLTADTTVEARRRALEAGARDFLTKPFDAEEVRLRVSSQLELRQARLELERRVFERTAELEMSQQEVVDRLAIAAEFRDDDTHQHAQRIGTTAAELADAVGGLNTEVMRRGAPLHDIGKIAIPDAILLKPGRLTESEFEIVKAHPQVGARILSGGQSELLQTAEEIALTHHERWDGHGYPNGLSAEAIPLSGRIVAVADVFDALTHERPYKHAWSVQRAVAEISNRAGIDFDPNVVNAFCALQPVRPSSVRAMTASRCGPQGKPPRGTCAPPPRRTPTESAATRLPDTDLP